LDTVGRQQGWCPATNTGLVSPFFFLSSFSSPLISLEKIAITGDPSFRPLPLPNLSMKIFPKVSSPTSPIYLENAPLFFTGFE
jgi:hypothetical protein